MRNRWVRSLREVGVSHTEGILPPRVLVRGTLRRIVVIVDVGVEIDLRRVSDRDVLPGRERTDRGQGRDRSKVRHGHRGGRVFQRTRECLERCPDIIGCVRYLYRRGFVKDHKDVQSTRPLKVRVGHRFAECWVLNRVFDRARKFDGTCAGKSHNAHGHKESENCQCWPSHTSTHHSTSCLADAASPQPQSW